MASGVYQYPSADLWQNLNWAPPEGVGPYAGNPNWLTRSSLVYAHVTDKNRVESLDAATGRVTVWPAGGPNQLFAGGGVWASRGEGGYWDSHGRNPAFPYQSEWVPFCVDTLTGLIGLCLDNTQRDFCTWDGMTLTPIMSGDGEKLACFTNGVLRLVYQQTWYQSVLGGPLTQVGTLTTVADGARFSHGWNLAFYGPRGAQVIWPDWQPELGIEVSAGVLNHRAQIYRATESSPFVSVIGSSGAGELAGEQQIWTVDLAAKTVQFTNVHGSQPPVPYRPINLLDPDPPVPPIPPIVLEASMLTLKRSRLKQPSVNFPGRSLCVMNNGEYLHVDPMTMGVYQSGSDDDKAAWITKPGSGEARLEIEAYFIAAKVDEKA